MGRDYIMAVGDAWEGKMGREADGKREIGEEK